MAVILSIPFLSEGLSPQAMGLSPQAEGLSTMAEGLPTMAEGLSPQAEGLSPQAEGLSTMAEGLPTMAEDLKIPESFSRRIEKHGSRTPNKDEIKELIVQLCEWKDLSSKELSSIIQRSEKYLKNEYLKELIEAGKINYTIPQMVKHPKQKYTSKTNV